MITIKDVARLARVSTSTVSRVISNNGFVSQKTRERVLDAIQRLGYRPNTLARGLKYSRSNVIGVVMADIWSPYAGALLRGLEQPVEQADMRMIVCSGHADKKSEIRAIESLLEYRCEVLILNVEEITVSESEDILPDLIQDRVPLVMLGVHIPKYAENSVELDNEGGGFLATEYLISQGHQDIIHLTGSLKYRDSRARLAGYKTALQQAGLPYRKQYILLQ